MNFPEIYSATGMMELIQKIGFLPRDSSEIASEFASLLSLLVRLADFDVGVLSKF